MLLSNSPESTLDPGPPIRQQRPIQPSSRPARIRTRRNLGSAPGARRWYPAARVPGTTATGNPDSTWPNAPNGRPPRTWPRTTRTTTRKWSRPPPWLFSEGGTHLEQKINTLAFGFSGKVQPREELEKVRNRFRAHILLLSNLYEQCECVLLFTQQTSSWWHRRRHQIMPETVKYGIHYLIFFQKFLNPLLT